MKKIFLLTIIACLSILDVVAGIQSENDLELLYFNHGDSVSLRWAPIREEVFRKSASVGYVVQRRLEGETAWQSISQPLFPMSNEKMEVNESFNDYYEAIREIIYHKGRDANKNTPAPSGGGIYSVEGETPLEDDLLLAMALFSCDFSVDAARAAAVLYVDKNIVKGAKYQYRVVLGDEVNKSHPKVGVCSVNTSVLSVLPKMEGFDAEFREWDVFFSWPIAKHAGYYSGYMVERGLDSLHFKPVKERPIVHSFAEDKFQDLCTFIDSVPDQDHVYYYRVKGLSPFGFYGPASKVVKGQAKFNFNQIQVKIDTVVYTKKNEANISWTVDKKYEKRIKGFRVLKSENLKSYTDLTGGSLLPAKQRKFKDPKIARTNYYAVEAIGFNKDERVTSGFHYEHIGDTIPPAIPVGLKADVDSSGVVRISWKPNTDSDLLGYRVYSSNSGRDDDFFHITDYYKDTVLYDTLNLNTLTNCIYYKVSAVDKNYNTSPRSKAIKALRPDTVAPIGVVFEFLTQDENGVSVVWENSPSEDFAYMELYRQIDDTGKVALVKRFDAKKRMPTKYVDDSVGPGVMVQYFMYVYDQAGNKTFSRTNRMQSAGSRPGCVQDVRAVVYNTERLKEIRLSWKRRDGVNISRYVIYRKEDDGRMLPVESVSANELFYIDKEVALGSSYVYIVRAISTEFVCPAVYTDPIEFAGTVK